MPSLLVVLALAASPTERFDEMLGDAVERRLELLAQQKAALEVLEKAQAGGAAGKLAGVSKNLDKAKERQLRFAFKTIAAPAPALNQLQTATAIAAAGAAVNASPTGVEAGVSVSPLLLAGVYDFPFQPTVTLATVEKGVVRAGLGVGVRLAPEALGPASLGLKACSLERKDVTQAFETYRFPFLVVCEALASPHLAALDPDEKTFAEQACSGEGEAPKLVVALGTLAKVGEALSTGAQPKTRVELGAQASLVAAVSVLSKPKFPTIDDCWTDEAVAAAADTFAVNAATLNIGVSANVDLLPLQWGFGGDSTLSQGEYKRWEARLEGRWSARGYELGGALGFSRGREGLGKPLYNALAFQGRVSAIVLKLSSDDVRTGDGRLAAVGGALPPHLVLGFAVTGEAALTRPASQLAGLNKLDLTPYVEAHIGEKLAVRLGVPVRAEIVTKAAVPATADMAAQAEVKDLQWSIPPTLTTIIKLD